MLNQGSGHGKSSWDTLTTAKVSLIFVAPPSWIITGLSLQHTALKVNLKKDSQPTLMSLLVGCYFGKAMRISIVELRHTTNSKRDFKTSAQLKV